jgi:hypothetical protein
MNTRGGHSLGTLPKRKALRIFAPNTKDSHEGNDDRLTSMPTLLTPPTLEVVLQGLHDSEIRCGIQNELPAGGIDEANADGAIAYAVRAELVNRGRQPTAQQLLYRIWSNVVRSSLASSCHRPVFDAKLWKNRCVRLRTLH